MSNCEMNIEKCLYCPIVRKIPSIYAPGISGEMIAPLKLVCEITDEELEVTKCIKEA